MCGDALKECLVFPRALYSSQGPVYHSSILVYNIQLKQHMFGHNNISVPTVQAGLSA